MLKVLEGSDGVYVGFEVFTAVTMKNAVSWDVAPRRSCETSVLQTGYTSTTNNFSDNQQIITA
jgi:hypothetical protein